MVAAYLCFLNMKHALEYCDSLLDGMLVHRRVTPQKYFIHLGEERQCDGRGLNPGPPDPEFEVLTARPHTSSHKTSVCNGAFVLVA